MSKKYLWDVKMRWAHKEKPFGVGGVRSEVKVIVSADGEQGATEAIKTAFAIARESIIDVLGQTLEEGPPDGSTLHLVSLTAGEEAFDGE